MVRLGNLVCHLSRIYFLHAWVESLFLSYHTVVVCLCAHSQHHVTDLSDRFRLKNKNARIHSPFFINLVAEPMEPIHAELLRLAKCKPSATRYETSLHGPLQPCQVQVFEHDRRLNHREAWRHLPQQFGGSRLDYGDCVSAGWLCSSPIT